MFKLQKTECSFHLIHFGVNARSHDAGFTSKAKILKVIDALFGFEIVTYNGPALKGVKDFGGMEAEYG